jgi:4-amino-4-deoxy-L-arabinose transferase-like glycosyltransferase
VARHTPRVAPWVVLALILAAYGAWQAAHLGGAYWDTDEGINLMKARMVQSGYRLYRDIWADQPPGLTVILAGAFGVFGAAVPVARAVVVIHGLVALIAVAWIARECGAGWLGAFAAMVGLAVAPNFFWASRAVMIGLPALSLATLALAMILAYTRTGRRRWLMAAGLVLGLSLLEKLIGVYLVIPFALAVLLRRSPRAWRSSLRVIGADLLIFGAMVALPLLWAVTAFDAPRMLDQVVGSVARARGAYPLDLGWNLDKLAFWLRFDHLFLVGLSAYGALALAWTRSRAAAVVLTWLALTVPALALQTPLWPKHHFLALLVILAPLAGIGVDDLWRRLRARRVGTPAERVWLGVGAAAALVALVGLPAMVRADAKRLVALPYKESGKLPDSTSYQHVDDAVRLVQAATSPDDFIVTDHGFVAFSAGRKVPPELAVVSGKRLAVGDLTPADLIAITERYRPTAILLWDGDRLSRIPAYADWVKTHFRPGGSVADVFWLYVPDERP